MIERFGLYVILTNPVVGYEAAAEAAVAESVAYLQLRMKNVPPKTLLQTARAIRDITANTTTRFIVNDDVKIAMAVDADGVHLGQDDMDIDAARAQWNQPGKVYGLSTHNPFQSAKSLERKPDYIGVGPVFATPTKIIPDPVVGLKTMGAIIADTPLTTVAIGGIDEANLADVLAHGAINFCAVRAIMRSDRPREVIKRMTAVWKEAEIRREFDPS